MLEAILVPLRKPNRRAIGAVFEALERRLCRMSLDERARITRLEAFAEILDSIHVGLSDTTGPLSSSLNLQAILAGEGKPDEFFRCAGYV